jgi:hypothetical protein
MKNIAKKIAGIALAAALTAPTADAFTRTEFYNAFKAKFPNSVLTDSLKTKQYEYKKDGTPVQMTNCVMLNKTGADDYVYSRIYADYTPTAAEDSATDLRSILYQGIDTTQDLNSTVSALESKIKGQPSVKPNYHAPVQIRKDDYIKGNFNVCGQKIRPQYGNFGITIRNGKRMPFYK